MSVLVATAYMEEAARFDWLVAMDDGRVLATGTPAELLSRTGARDLDTAFIALLPEEKRRGHQELTVPPRPPGEREVIIEAHNLTQRFGSFTAVDHVNFRIERGEIYGFLGANGCGKSTTMKMLCGLLPPSDGEASLFGEPVNANDLSIRSKVGYMSQAFSLYSELSVRQNLVLHARLFHVPQSEIPGRVENTARDSDWLRSWSCCPTHYRSGNGSACSLPWHDSSPRPLDPRRADLGRGPGGPGRLLGALDRSVPPREGDNLRLHPLHQRGPAVRPHLADERRKGAGHRHAGRRGQQRGAATLEEAFIGYLEDAEAAQKAAQRAEVGSQRSAGSDQTSKVSGQKSEIRDQKSEVAGQTASSTQTSDLQPLTSGPHLPPLPSSIGSGFSLQRMLSCSYRELLELSRDPIRLTMAGLGSLILMIIMGYGVTLDVEHLTFAVLDRDQTRLSRDYVFNIAGASRYFVERSPISDYEELDRRMRSGEISMAVEIPPNFGRDVEP